jgi:hypothetical protein
VHEHPRLGELGKDDRASRADDGVRVLHEHVERARLALRVLPVVRDARQDLAGARKRRQQAYRLERDRGRRRAQAFELRAQRIERIDQLDHRLLRRSRADGSADIDDAAFGEEPGPDRTVAREQRQSHGWAFFGGKGPTSCSAATSSLP